MIHKEGRTLLLLVGAKFLVLNLALYFLWPEYIILRWALGIIALIGFLFLLQFFRNPNREFNLDHNSILCPADGKVVVIEETEETEYLKEKRIQVSVFMSPINVHVNRNPVDGIISYFKYHPGKYLVAWHPKSSTENERTTVVYKLKDGSEILIRQIAGAVARRIKWYIKANDVVKQGEDFGFIKFGSRVDLFLPLDYKINVKIGDVVKGGITSIASLK